MKRRENLMLQGGVTMYLSEAEFNKREKEKREKALKNASTTSNNNYGGGGGIWIPIVNGGQAGSMGPSFTDVDWRKTLFGQS